MAGDRHGKHNTTTISFRVNSYEKATIEERVKVSGMKKQDYIVRSCIYNHVCVVGKKETIEIIRSEMKEMSLVLEDVAKDLKSEKPVISEPVLDSMTERYLAFLEAALWMLKGSSYLWEDKKDGRESNEGLSITSTFFPAFASPTARFTQLVVLPTPPFCEHNASTLQSFITFSSILFILP